MDSASGPETEPAVSKDGVRWWRRAAVECLEWFRTLASSAVYATLVITFGVQVARVEGRSMEPTLNDQDRLVIGKLAYIIHAPELGDIVMVRHPNHPDQILVKRVVAGPGDTVAFRDGQLVRNGVPMREDFVSPSQRSHENQAAETIPPGYYYVLGDHRDNSSDSRLFGPVPKMYILGKVEVRWWPLTKARAFKP